MGPRGTRNPFPDSVAHADNTAGNTGDKSPSTYSEPAEAKHSEAYEGLCFSTEIWFRRSGQGSELGLQENNTVTTQRLHLHILEYQL